MIKPRTRFLIVGLLAGLLGAAPVAPTAAESALIRQRIDDLLQRRQQPTPLPQDPPNPFVVAAAGLVGGATPAGDAGLAESSPAMPASVVGNSGEEIGPANTAELLARFASRLRITGLIRLKEQLHVIINDSTWKEGDYMILHQGSRVIRLQVLRIQPGQLTLRLEDAELMLRF